MKLLLDNNLSPRLVARLSEVFPHMSHVSSYGLERAADLKVWQFAKDEGFGLLTKDADFNELLAMYGFPPKVVWIRRGNCTTEAIEVLLRMQVRLIADFAADERLGILELY